VNRVGEPGPFAAGAPAAIERGLDGVASAPSIVSIGFFDGVHRGHRSIIHRAVRQAQRRGHRSVVVTFDRHPMEVIRPGSQPKLLMTLKRRADTLARQGVDLVVVLPFDDELRHLDADAFIDHVLLGPLEAAGVVVGANFRFGHKAAGDVHTLTELGERHGFGVEGVTLLEADGSAISSSVIRACVEDGDVARAAQLLGRPHVVDGVVVRGDQRGAGLGFPTANLQVDPRVAVPGPGVYATMLHHPDGRALPAATSVGTNPTFGGQELRVEAYCLDFDEDLYGVEVGLAFQEWIRGEQRFESVDALVARIHEDVTAVRRTLGVG
jgi:riboflavin kinase / FMN adenylyltransferase